MWYTDKNAPGVLQHLSANQKQELWRVQTITYARMILVEKKRILSIGLKCFIH